MKMSEDIIRQAELRYRRRPVARSGDLTLLTDRLHATITETEAADSLTQQVVYSEVSQTFVDDVTNQNDIHYDSYKSVSQPALTLPFVDCKVSDVDGKALISTCCKKSLLSKSMFNTLRLPDSRLPNVSTSVLLQDRIFDHRFEVRDDIPDIVFGTDFLITYKCTVNFSDMTLSVDGGALHVPFLEKTDIPLKYRVHRNLAASF